ncbi:uncharacterized protein HMPREF1541_00838 [Cyphellophora europaea CBS 101466]|uniref:Uncharacterized protein n=1 Tax=Cyphellophora europaea (strain CBS 101466) TaxID=1220924 RepID=W2SD68_CYPE1|nr:uncharacterized protein HMPREF1541_00838 [Cyphellophora europaea CBS 101466]ETN46652.1 hypothetical protein HMPREF1541_00838 [Cyphellophora europaea CBS 101466]
MRLLKPEDAFAHHGIRKSQSVEVHSVSGVSETSATTDILRSKSNTGKIVLQRHGIRIWTRYWIHFLAIAATGGVAALNLLNVYLMDSDDPNIVAKIGAFQFVAKLHEAAMLGSLTLIMIDAVRSGLMSSSGVPLGYLMSPVMYNNIDWLLSASLWTNRPTTGHLWSHTLRQRSALSFFLLLLLAIVFANIAGPMSAILIVPRLGWSSSDAAALFPTFWNVSATDFWPEEFAAASLPPKCSQGGAMGTMGCPAKGSKSARIRLSPVFGPGVGCTTEGFQSTCNVSLSETVSANAIGRVLSVDFDLDASNAYATTPTAAIFEALALRFESGVAFPLNITDTRVVEAGKAQLLDIQFDSAAGMFKPAVATACRELQYDEIVELYQDRNISTNWSTPAVTWLADAQGLDKDSFLFSYRIDSPDFDNPSKCDGEDCYAAVACAIAPRWCPSQLWYNTAQQSLLFQSLPQPRDIFKKNESITKPILLRKDWLELTTVDQDTKLAANIVDLFNEWRTPRVRAPQAVQGRIQENIGPTNHSDAIAIILASTVTEAIAAGPAAVGESIYSGDCNDTKPGFTFSPAICAQDPSFWIHSENRGDSVQTAYSMVAFTVRRSGWGWFLQDSLTIYIALGTLLFHGALTLMYLTWVLVSKKNITTRWSLASELLVLAIDSFRAPKLADSSIRVRNRKIWLEPVSIREVDGGDRLSLIVGDPTAYPERVGPPPLCGKKYL